MALKKYQNPPIHVVEYHNDVLPYIYRSIGSKHLPSENLTLLHFDSHPDLGIPLDLECCDVFKKENLYDKISIESWILPAVYAGHFNKVIWVKPPWADQISQGDYRFYVGQDLEDSKLKASLKHSYFIDDGVYQAPCNMKNMKELDLHVISIESGDCIQAIQNTLNKATYVLDIDLDFYSTKNPFQEMFGTDDLKKLTSIYECESLDYANMSDSEVLDVQDRRMVQLEKLEAVWQSIIRQGNKQDDYETYSVLKNISVKYEEQNGKPLNEEDVDILHGAGCTTGDPPLPHHVSTKDEIDKYVALTQDLMKCLRKPTIVTIARSSIDDYCPPEQVDQIQDAVVSMLSNLYPNFNVVCHYDDDS